MRSRCDCPALAVLDLPRPTMSRRDDRAFFGNNPISMKLIDIARTVFHELTERTPLERVPEPEMLMEELDQVAAYAASGRVADGVMAAANLFHAARASMVIARSHAVLDLGCGPATQLVAIARLNPEKQFVGVELSSGMLSSGRDYIEAAGVRNVRLEQDDITRLNAFGDASFDAVVSTMTLHHLPSTDELRACLSQVRRVLKPGGAVYLADFGRLRTEAAVRLFSHMHSNSLPPVVVKDYENSLRAAFSLTEYRSLTWELFGDEVRVFATALAPVLVVIKTVDHSLEPSVRQLLRTARAQLSSEYRGDLDSLRAFFLLGGMARDPFR